MSTQSRHAQDFAVLVEDLEFMVAMGEHPDWIAARLGTTVPVLARRLCRNGRNDLARPFWRLDGRWAA